MHINPFIEKTERVFPMQGRRAFLRYDMNENPEGLPSDFVEEVKKEITPEFLATYPEPDRFLKRYADYMGVDFSQVMATNGSDMAIRYLLETFGEVGKDVVTVSPSFEMYWVNCNILGLHHVPVSYEEDMTIDIEKILAAITEDTRIVVLLNPNNPMGNSYAEEEAERIIAKAEEMGALVIVDEAYHYFHEGTLLNLVKHHDNVALLRTFSKLFSLAACRLGVITASEKVIEQVKKSKLTFDVNSIALLFGEKLLDHPEIEQKLIAAEKEGKAYLLEAMRGKGYECRECKGNFVLVKTGIEPQELAQRLEEKKVLIKTFSKGLLKGYIRVSTGSKKAMEKFVEILTEVTE